MGRNQYDGRSSRRARTREMRSDVVSSVLTAEIEMELEERYDRQGLEWHLFGVAKPRAACCHSLPSDL